MDLEDWTPTLQVPAGSKRPSPSPSDGEDRAAKKSRSQPCNDNPNHDTLNQELPFPIVDLSMDEGPGNSVDNFSDTPWGGEGVSGDHFDAHCSNFSQLPRVEDQYHSYESNLNTFPLGDSEVQRTDLSFILNNFPAENQEYNRTSYFTTSWIDNTPRGNLSSNAIISKVGYGD